MRALWVEDHHLIADSIEALVGVLLPHVSLDKARTVDEAVLLASVFRYECVMLDWWMGVHDGAHTLQRLRATGCQAPVVVISGDDNPQLMAQLGQLGIRAYVNKASDTQLLVNTLKDVLGGLQNNGLVAVDAAEPCGEIEAAASGFLNAYPELTHRQAEVFAYLMKGLSDKSIAKALDISDNTVRSHVRAILQVVGASKRGEAVYLARQRGAGVN